MKHTVCSAIKPIEKYRLKMSNDCLFSAFMQNGGIVNQQQMNQELLLNGYLINRGFNFFINLSKFSV